MGKLCTFAFFLISCLYSAGDLNVECSACRAPISITKFRKPRPIRGLHHLLRRQRRRRLKLWSPSPRTARGHVRRVPVTMRVMPRRRSTPSGKRPARPRRTLRNLPARRPRRIRLSQMPPPRPRLSRHGRMRPRPRKLPRRRLLCPK
jgi:hypothetical protein